MKIEFNCTYCGHKWIEVVYNQYSIKDKRCVNGRCFDRNLIAVDVAKNIDYYVGCKPFPEKKAPDDPMDMYSHLGTD